VPLDYFGSPGEWIGIERFQTIGQWHAAKQSLTVAAIDARMAGDGPSARGIEKDLGFELLVQRRNLNLAEKILAAHRVGRLWCPNCGSTHVLRLKPGLGWYVYALAFLGLAPTWPPGRRCEICRHEW
jgi:hypothetical protein